MADEDYRTAVNLNIINGCFKLPRIQVPIVFEEDDWGDISFKIETSKGVIKVISSHVGRWRCSGDVHSLVTAGFIQASWCPGLPENNKTMQKVIFENNIPRLIYGHHRGTALPSPHITIILTSKNKFAVEIPATKKQMNMIAQARERAMKARQLRSNEYLLKEQQKKKEDKLACYSNPLLFKGKVIEWFDLMAGLAIREMRGEHEYSHCGEKTIWFDEQSMQEVIQEVMRTRQNLVEAVQKATVKSHKKEPRLSIIKSI